MAYSILQMCATTVYCVLRLFILEEKISEMQGNLVANGQHKVWLHAIVVLGVSLVLLGTIASASAVKNCIRQRQFGDTTVVYTRRE